MLSAVPLGTQPIHPSLLAQPHHCQLLEPSSIITKKYLRGVNIKGQQRLFQLHTHKMLQKLLSGQGIQGSQVKAALQKVKTDSEGD